MVRRSNRLHSFFGENVSAHLIKKSSLDSNSKKTNEELDALRKKWTKLQNFLGEKLPLTCMISQKPTRSIEDTDAKDFPQNMFYNYQSILQEMTNAIEDATQLIEILYTFSNLDTSLDMSSNALNTTKRRVSIEVELDKNLKNGNNQSEKKVIKLENIFGPDIGVTALLRQIELQIMTELESLILNDISDPGHQKTLILDIEKARSKIHSKITALSSHCRIVE